MINKRNMNRALPGVPSGSAAISTNSLWAELRERAAALSGHLSALPKTLDTWRLRHITRRDLANADPRILKDVGISEAQRFIEVNKSCWEE